MNQCPGEPPRPLRLAGQSLVQACLEQLDVAILQAGHQGLLGGEMVEDAAVADPGPPGHGFQRECRQPGFGEELARAVEDA